MGCKELTQMVICAHATLGKRQHLQRRAARPAQTHAAARC